MTRWNWQRAAFLAATLGMGFSAAAQTSSGGTAGSGGTGTASSSPGTGPQGQSETGVGVPGNAPANRRTLEPLNPVTRQNTQEQGQSQPLVDMSGGSSNTATGAGGTGAGATQGGEAKLSSSLRDGLEKLHAGDQAEIQSGQMAQQAATNPDVKAFGQRMVTDHTQNDQQLTAMAQTMGVNLEGKAYQKQTKDAQKMARKYEGKTGSAFDQAYISAMVKDHEKDAKDVRKLASQAQKDGNSELASFLNQTEQTMQEHLTEAKRIQSSLGSASNAPSSSTTGTGSSGTGQ